MRSSLVALVCVAAVASRSAWAGAEAPVSLTSSDGTGLKLVKLVARGVVEDPLAFTELTLTFENPLDRTLEGQFKVTLPQGATVSRFAMKLDDRWQEGEVVERQAARRAYEDFLHRRQDPALLEQSGGNEFSARVFPIPPKGVKQLVLAYSHELVSAGTRYVLPLKGLPEVGELDVQVAGVDGEASLQKKHFVPTADFSVKPRAHAGGVRSKDLVVARVVPVAGDASDPLTAVTLLVDSSGSRALGWRDEVTLVQKLLASLTAQFPSLKVSVLAFDQQVAPVYSGLAKGFGDAQARQLLARRALGASNVELALKAVKDAPTPRVILVSDGVFTAGSTEGPNLQAQVLKLKSAGVERLDVVAVGGIRDDAALARLAQGSLARDGAVLGAELGNDELARRLALATRSKLDVKVEGAVQAWPKTLAGVQAGDAVLVYAQLPSADTVLKVAVGGRPMPVTDAQLTSIEAPLLARAWAKARIDALQAELDRADGPAQREKVKQAIVELSVKSRVLSNLTALLVLETEADYARFHIDRRALADILTVKDGHVSVTKRSADSVTVAVQKPPPPPPREVMKEEAKKQSSADDGVMQQAEAKPDDSEEKVAEQEVAPVADVAPAAESPRAQPAVPAPPPPPAPRPSGGTPGGAVGMPLRASGGAARGPSPEAASLPTGVDPYTGTFKKVMDSLKTEPSKALSLASGWHEEQPGDLLALAALGEALEATGDLATAARAWGSIIDLFPARADLRRFAGLHLERLNGSLDLAIDTFKVAAEQRADHPASHRLLAFALLKAGKLEAAFEAIAKGVAQRYPEGRFAGVDRILREDAGLIAAAWKKAEPGRAADIDAKLKAIGGTTENAPSLRFVLNWETDANDVDFHIVDAKGGHAFYSQRQLASGGELYADVTTGYGPECFTIRLPPGKRAAPYHLLAHYYSIGPMGAGMGKLEIIEHDGHGGLRFEERPYVVMVNQAFVDLGVVK